MSTALTKKYRSKLQIPLNQNKIDVCSGVTRTSDGGFCLVGSSRFGMTDSVYAMAARIDSDGELIWQRVFDEYPHGDYLRDVVQTADGGFATAGYGRDRDLDFYLLRLDSEGNVLWRKYYDQDRSSEQCFSMLLMEDGGYAMAGFSSDLGGLLVRTEPDTTNMNAVDLLDPAYPSEIVLNSPYPNPFNSSTTISYTIPKAEHVTITIFDQFGHEVTRLIDTDSPAGTHRRNWQDAKVPAGMYMMMLTAGGESRGRKVVVVD